MAKTQTLERVNVGKILEMIADVNAQLKTLGYEPDEYGWNVTSELQDAYSFKNGEVEYGTPHLWPSKYRWIACYAVTGGSEGHYMHLDVHDGDGKYTHVALAKTFQGIEFAYDVCKATAMLLEA